MASVGERQRLALRDRASAGSVAAPAARCRAEAEAFRCGEPTDGRHSYDLFRRALCDRDERAWDALIAVYDGLVRAWVRRHPSAPDPGAEEAFVAGAFARLREAVDAARFATFPNAETLLRYLKLCVHSALLDERRARETTVEGKLAGKALWEAVQAQVRDEAERLVAALCLSLDMKPREVQARHPAVFASVDDVYRVKRDLLERLQRGATIRELRD